MPATSLAYLDQLADLPIDKIDDAPEDDVAGEWSADDADKLRLEVTDLRSRLQLVLRTECFLAGVGCVAGQDITSLLIDANTRGIDFTLPPGTFQVTDNVTLSNCRGRRSKGTVINVAATKNVHWGRGFDPNGVPETPCFTGAGTHTFDPIYTRALPIECWGTDAAAAHKLKASGVRKMILQERDYFSTEMLEWDVPYTEIEGVSPTFPGDVGGTRWITMSATLTMARFGYAVDPGGGANSFCAGLKCKGVSFHRGFAPAKAANLAAANPGILVQYAFEPEFDWVLTRESQVGWRLKGTVAPRFRHCRAFRSAAATGAGTDFNRGWHLDGSLVYTLGLAGGNASVFMERCSSSMGGAGMAAGWDTGTNTITGIDSISLYADEGYSDVFIDWFETVGSASGVIFYGLADSGNTTAKQNGNHNVQIRNLILDAATVVGVRVEKQSNWGHISIAGGYLAPVGLTQNVLAVHVKNSGGSVNIQGFGAPMTGGGTGRGGLKVESSSGVNSQGNTWIGAHWPVILESAVNCRIEDTINNPNETTSNGAVFTNGVCKNLRIAPIVMGGAGKFNQGVYVSGTSLSDSTIDTTMMDTAAINGGAANLVVYNGAQVKPGQAGNNLLVGPNLLKPVVGTISAITASGNFTAPADSSSSTVYCARIHGAGGGGGGSNGASAASAGGGCGEYREVIFTGLAAGATVAVGIGAAGAAGANTGTDGGNGGDTTFALPGGTVTAAGGQGGKGATTAVQTLGGAGGTGGGGAAGLTLAGGAGEPAYPGTKGGGGASSLFGRGGYGGGAYTGVGGNASGYGAGGGGSGGTTAAGKLGTAGIVIVDRLTA